MAICNCYFAAEITANQNFVEWNNQLYTMISKEIVKLKADDHMIVVMGDLNAHIGRQLGGALQQNSLKVNRNGKKLIEFIRGNKLICENTREASGNWHTWSAIRGERGLIRTCIDYCLTYGMNHLPKEFNIVDEERTSIETDHKLIQFRVKVPTTRKRKKNKKKAPYSLGSMKNVDAYKSPFIVC